MTALKLLILGGSGEAADLARALDGDPRYDVTLSLAGRTADPALLPGRLRKGGFGGAEGLARSTRARTAGSAKSARSGGRCRGLTWRYEC